MQIAGYLKTSLIEWPGKISSVVFVPGCNFRCPFCHNADLADPKRIRRLTLIPEEEIFKDLEKRKKWVDGIVVTGGEPTLQTDLPKFLKSLKKMGFETMIETNGSKPEVIDKLLNRQMIDYIAMDVKGPLDQKYLEIVGYKKLNSKNQKHIENIKKSVGLISNSGIDFEFRTTVVPGMHDQKILLKMAEEIKQLTVKQKLHTANCKLSTDSYHWFLQNFQPKNCLDPEFEKRKPFSNEELQGFLRVVREVIPQTELRGV